MTEAIERARQIAKMVLGGEYDPLLACRELADIRRELSSVADEVMDVFVAVDSEVDDLPIGLERAHWKRELLLVKDLQAAKYRDQVRRQVEEALRRLLEVIGNDRDS
jgi:hypothetical protein